MDESKLIQKSEDFLKKIDEQPPNFKNLDNKENFIETYNKINENLEFLQNIKEKMDLNGYSAPFRSLNRYGQISQNDEDLEELSETKRHNRQFRIKAMDKKNTLDRIKSAIDAHKIALGNLDSYAYFECEKCKKTYTIQKHIQKGKCTCDGELNFKIQQSNIYRIEILEYLPLSGNYLVLMSQLTEWGRNALKKVLKILKTQRKSVVTNVSPVIRIKEDGRIITKRISLDSQFANSYEEELREKYGKNFSIESLDFHRSKPSIINDKHTRKALAIAYVRYTEEIIKENKDKIAQDNFRNIGNLEQYDKIQTIIKLSNPVYLEELDTIEEWREQKLKENLQEAKLMDKYGNLDRKLERDIKRRKQLENKVFSRIAPTLITWDMFKYYLTSSQDKRSRQTGPFPYIRNDIDKEQRKVFKMSEKSVQLLQELKQENIIHIKDMDLILYEKFQIEKKIKNSNFKIKYNGLAAALVHKQTQEPIENLTTIFNTNQKEIKTQLKNIESINKPKTDKSRKFLEMIKN